MQHNERAGIALSMLVVLYALGFTNLFLRNSLGILAPTLSEDMRLSPEALSLVASSFFFAYAAMQVPGGMLLDRFGARRTLAGLLVFTDDRCRSFRDGEQCLRADHGPCLDGDRLRRDFQRRVLRDQPVGGAGQGRHAQRHSQ